MKTCVACHAAAFTLVCAAALGADTEARPNIVLILADDLGYSDLGCYGGEIATPNLDRLAENGLRFSQFYNAARCCPTRAALLTGHYPHAAGVGHMTGDRGLPGYGPGLSKRCATIAEALQAAGYSTWMSGKWHVGEGPGNWPVQRGFDRYYGLLGGASSYFKLWPNRRMAIDDRPYVPDEPDFYMTDAITERAIEFLERDRSPGKPFFLYLAYTAPHAPLHARPQDIARYAGRYDVGWDAVRERRDQRLRELGLIDSRWKLAPRNPDVPAWADVPDKAHWALRMAVYAAQVDVMDHGIGRVLEKLQELGVADDTLVIFLSDNGGCAEEADCSAPGAPPGHPDCDLGYGVGWANASNTPFRYFKREMHEGGIATPMIVRWPKGAKGDGRITHAFGHVIDILPTCLDAASATYPTRLRDSETTAPAGRSLLHVLRGEERPREDVIGWEHEGNRGLRRGKWKLVARHLRPWELYDMEADRTELNDLAAEHPRVVEELSRAYDTWAEANGVVPWERLPPIKKRGRAAPEGPVAVKAAEPQLFIDDWLIAEQAGVKRTLHSPKKDGGGQAQAIAPLPGSETLMAKGSIVRDPRLGRYVMFVKDLPSRNLFRLTSDDGLTWRGESGTAPDRVELDDRHPVTGTRVERQMAAMHCIHYDARDERYPYKGWVFFGNWGVEHEGVYFIRSADGLRWERGPRVLDGYAGRGDLSALRIELGGVEVYGPGDTTRFAYDPDGDRYLAIFKYFSTWPVGPGNHLRSRAYAFIDRLDQPVDYRCMTDVQLVPPAVDTAHDRASDEYYESTAWRYAGMWLGELLVWHERDDYPWSEAGGSFVKLVSSRDGLNWTRVAPVSADGSDVFIPAGPQGGNDGRNDGGHLSLFSQGPLRVGDELIFYYGASSWGKTAPPERRVTGGGIFRARLRVDGFVSVDAGAVLTRPLRLAGRSLFLNAEGRVDIEAVSDSGETLGTARSEGDGIRLPITFAGRQLGDVARGQSLRLRFAVPEGSRLYAFTVE